MKCFSYYMLKLYCTDYVYHYVVISYAFNLCLIMKSPTLMTCVFSTILKIMV